MSGKILRNYVSELDQFLNTFDKRHPELSQSQKKEAEKYQRIYALRDHAEQTEKNHDIWEGF